MQSLVPPPPAELDPETQAIVDEVCDALEWFHPDVPDSVAYVRALKFGQRWFIAFRNAGDAGCRQQIYAACDAIVRADDDVFISASPDGKTGPLYPREQIAEHQGRLVYERQDDGTMVRLLQWPTAFYANGEPCFERTERVA